MPCVLAQDVSVAQGNSETVLAPWSPLVANGNKVSVWGRRYVLSDQGLPVSVETAGASILNSSVRIRAWAGGKEVVWQKAKCSLIAGKGDQARYYSKASCDGMRLSTRTTIEYDGMIRIDFQIDPGMNQIDISSLILEIPIRKQFARYFHYAETSGWGSSNAGNIPAGGWKSSQFKPLIWVGDDDRGVAWFAENARNWYVPEGSSFLEVKPGSECTLLRVFLISTPVKVTKSLAYTFGLQATPVRALPADHRKLNYAIVGRSVPGKILVPRETLINLWWWIHFKKWFYPEAIDEPNIKSLISAYHQHGNQVITYFSPTHVKLPCDEYSQHADEWQVKPIFRRTSIEGQPVEFIHVCPKSKGWSDYYLSVIGYLIDHYDIDGLWLDDPYPWPCINAEHGDGYKDPLTGKVHPSYPIFATRELIKRTREIFLRKKGKVSLLVHMSGNMMIPIYSFADCYLDGEQYAYKRSGKPYENLPFDKVRAEFTGNQWGLAPFFILRTIDKDSAKEGCMISLLHGITPLYEANLHNLLDKFGVNEAEWVPYWSNPQIVSVTPDNVLVSAYKKGNSILLVLGNTDYTETTAKIFMKPAGPNKSFRAIDFESGDQVSLDHGNSFSVKINKRNYKLIKVDFL